MTDMVERVARAIALADWAEKGRADVEHCFSQTQHDPDCVGLPLECSKCSADYFRQVARAAIEAMKVPTEAMIAAVTSTRADWIGHVSPAPGVVERWIKATTNARLANYQAMISAALSEDTGVGKMPIYSGKNVEDK